jgi:AbrB family looped-hinge helix DNA binding protein
MRITSKGQVTIPQELRERYGFTPGTEVEFEADDGVLRLKRTWVPPTPEEIEAHTEQLEKAREEWAKGPYGGMTTDEIMQLTRGDD